LNKAIELDPKNARLWDNRATVHSRLGEWDKVLADRSKALDLKPEDPVVQNNLAWSLSICPEAKLRDPYRAVNLAASAVKAAPKEGNCWTTLGVARYRAGDWKGASAALQEALKLFQGTGGFQRGVGRSLFFLAMAQHQLGQRQEARQAYDRALAWLETNQKDVQGAPWLASELRRFQAEAAELLGIKDEKTQHQDTKDTKVKPLKLIHRPCERSLS